MPSEPCDLHVSFVLVAYLLHVDVVLAVYVGLCGGITVSDSHNAGDVLEVVMVVYFNLN